MPNVPGKRPSQWQCLGADFDRYLEGRPGWPRPSWLLRLRVAVTEESFWVIFWYRYGRWATLECPVPVIRQLCLLPYRVMFRLFRLLTGISISRHCEVGPGLHFGHLGARWINPGARLGRRVTVAQGVTIGLGGQGALEGVPEIGDHVFIGPNATLVGRMRVGNGCVVGANSLVVSDVEDGTTVVGVPARVVARGVNPVALRAAAEPGQAGSEGD
jgi:serine O-acetyltransferase